MHEVVIALIGLAGVIATASVGILKVAIERHKLIQAEQEVRFQRAALSFPEFVEEWDEIGKELVRLISETEVDRFMILRAWNGYLEPRWTTAVYQLRAAEQAPVAYVHFELDEDYVHRVKQIAKGGPISMITAELPHSEIKRVYMAEGVTASMWAHLDSFETTDGRSRAVAYCSFATHVDTLLTEKTMTRCRVLVGRLKGLATSFDRNPSAGSLRPPPV
jgi:hypothetical protein